MDMEYRIEVKVKNNIILEKIERAGYKTLGEFCRLNDMMKYVSQIGEVINMKASPLQADGKFRKCILWCGEMLGCDPEDFFTDTQLKTIVKSNKRHIKVNEAEMKFMLEKDNSHLLLEDIVHANNLPREVDEKLKTLTLREQKVLSLRFGLDDGKIYTLEECGEIFGVQRERIRQIEAKALRKLRHPDRADDLREYL